MFFASLIPSIGGTLHQPPACRDARRCCWTMSRATWKRWIVCVCACVCARVCVWWHTVVFLICGALLSFSPSASFVARHAVSALVAFCILITLSVLCVALLFCLYLLMFACLCWNLCSTSLSTRLPPQETKKQLTELDRTHQMPWFGFWRLCCSGQDRPTVTTFKYTDF